MGNRRNGLRFGSTAAGAVLLAAMIPATASAAAHSDTGKHCNFDANSGVQRCFGSVADALSALSDARTQAPSKLIVGTFFQNTGYGGRTLRVSGDGLCDGDEETDHQIDLPDEWKDTISSLQPWAKCQVWLHSEPDLGGDVDGPYKENTPNVGENLDDRAQSVKFS